MRLILLRHADAGDAREWAETGRPDSERPLSPKGRKQMKPAAAGLRERIPQCDVIATSPYTRAAQTAEIVSAAYGVPVEETDTLTPESPPTAFARWLREHRRADIVMAVGHEPHLGGLATWLMSGTAESHVEFKKAGACLLEFAGAVEMGAGVLRWLMGPRELAAFK